MKNTPSIEINPDFAHALDILEKSKKNAFITGKAGTGKSTLLQYFRTNTKKKIVVLAPTGVAALNVKGQTIHSFFRFPPHIIVQTVNKQRFSKKLKDMVNSIDTIVIDEVSMVRADLMDCIDASLRFYRKKEEPFGGLQMIFIGDLYQLPPVVSGTEERELFQTYYESPYFFDSNVIQDISMEFIELNKIYRQKDQEFIELLNKIRNGTIEDSDIDQLNTRLDPAYKPFDPDFPWYAEEDIVSAQSADIDNDADPDSDDFSITLTATNAASDSINRRKLSQLPSKTKSYDGVIQGKFENKQLPTAVKLDVKIGAQIMLLTNDMGKRWVNGSIGKVIDITHDKETKKDAVIVLLSNGKEVEVTPYTWEGYRYFFNKELGHLDVEIVGSFSQYPFRLAWAVTIHKSQGKTFDHVVIDLGRGSFAQGQVYVAISRCTSFEGLVLRKPILKKHIWADYHIMQYLTQYQYSISERNMPLQKKLSFLEYAVNHEKTIEITYLKANDTKLHRTVKPEFVGEMTYNNTTFLGFNGYCLERDGICTFRVDRILEIA